MSSIWTPSGEYRPQDEPDGLRDRARRAAAPPGPGDDGRRSRPRSSRPCGELHEQLRATPAVDIVANHVVQLFQLALVYLGRGRRRPTTTGAAPGADLVPAGLVIDAMAAIVDGLGPPPRRARGDAARRAHPGADALGRDRRRRRRLEPAPARGQRVVVAVASAPSVQPARAASAIERVPAPPCDRSAVGRVRRRERRRRRGRAPATRRRAADDQHDDDRPIGCSRAIAEAAADPHVALAPSVSPPGTATGRRNRRRPDTARVLRSAWPSAAPAWISHQSHSPVGAARRRARAEAISAVSIERGEGRSSMYDRVRRRRADAPHLGRQRSPHGATNRRR